MAMLEKKKKARKIKIACESKHFKNKRRKMEVIRTLRKQKSSGPMI